MPDGFSFDELQACAEREVAMRERVYPRRVAELRMSHVQAVKEIAMMKTIATILKGMGQPDLPF